MQCWLDMTTETPSFALSAVGKAVHLLAGAKNRRAVAAS
jgi:hypothetical protein